MPSSTIKSIWVYPIKGFSGQKLTHVDLKPGVGIAGDRRFALRHGASAYRPEAPQWHRKAEFVMLAHGPLPATVTTELDAGGRLRISRASHELFVGNIASAAARRGASAVLGRAVADPRGPVELVDSGALSLTDIETTALSIINLASVQALAAKIGFNLDPLRFRGNIVIDGLAPWAEFDWVGHEIKIGTATAAVMKRTGRCVATSVDPATAARDINVPAQLQHHFGHTDCGIYAKITGPGVARLGDSLTPA